MYKSKDMLATRATRERLGKRREGEVRPGAEPETGDPPLKKGGGAPGEEPETGNPTSASW